MFTDPLAASIVLGGIFALSALVFSTRHIVLHLRHYSQPEYQLHIVRILAMVPIYSLTSWSALLSSNERTILILDLLRDSYEAYVVYNFVVLLINYAGGDLYLCRYLESQPRMQRPFPLGLWLAPVKLGPEFVNGIRISVLQFVFVKPAGALLKLYIFLHGGNAMHRAFIVILACVNNVSVSFALYGLVMFYHAAHDLLRPFRPFEKFLSVKAVVFFSFWQGAALSVMVYLGMIRDVEGFTANEQATGLQDFLICVEMAVAAVAHYYVFSYHEHEDVHEVHEYAAPPSSKRALLDVMDFRDVLSDAKDRLYGGVGFESELREERHIVFGVARGGEAKGAPRYTQAQRTRPAGVSADLETPPWRLPEPPPMDAASASEPR